MATTGMASNAVEAIQALAKGLGTGDRDTFEFRAGPYLYGELRVVSFVLIEGLSELFKAEVVAVSAVGPAVMLPALVGQPACLSVRLLDGTTRDVQGVTSDVALLGHNAIDAHYRYRVTVRPRLWLLTKRRNSRIFQDQSAQNTVNTILAEHHVPARWNLSRELLKRDYCTQYEETDFAFVARLLSEEGVFFSFDHPSGVIDALGDQFSGHTTTGFRASSGAEDPADSVGTSAASALTEMGFAEEVVFGDSATTYAPVGASSSASLEAPISLSGTGTVFKQSVTTTPMVPYCPDSGLNGNKEFIDRFSLSRSFRTKAATVREYSPAHPYVPLQGTATVASVALHPGAQRVGSELASARVLSMLAGPPAGIPLALYESYDHREIAYGDTMAVALGSESTAEPGRSFAPRSDGGNSAPADGGMATSLPPRRARTDRTVRTLEGERTRVLVAEGRGTCRRMNAGGTFRLVDHPDEALCGEYVLTRIRHEGRTPELSETGLEPLQVYVSEFECVPAAITYRPKVRRRRARQVAETATVVGPGGQDIHTDAYERIRVRFHWDRRDGDSGHSTCWLRVVQPWAGPGFGCQFVPRTGTEVLVVFVDGDADRPVVVGGLSNATNPAPFTPELTPTVSGIRTRTTPNGRSGNELSFDDAAGAESLYIRAERTMQRQVVANDSLAVGGDRSTTIGGGLAETIGEARSTTVGTSDNLSVGGDRTVTIGGDLSLAVTGRLEYSQVGDARVELANGVLTAAGDLAVTVERYVSARIGTEGGSGGLSISVEGHADVDASSVLTLSSDTAVELRCGTSSVVVGPDSVQIQANAVVVRGTEYFAAFGNGPMLKLGDRMDAVARSINAYSDNGTIELDDAGIRAEGAEIHLNSDPTSSLSPGSESSSSETRNIRWRLTDAFGVPYANKTYKIVTHGYKWRGTTDADGFLSETVPTSATTAHVTVWTSSYPSGPTRDLTMTLLELPPSTDLYGAQTRLANLGLYKGKQVEEATAELRAAISTFQSQYGLPPTGELDAATASALDKAHTA